MILGPSLCCRATGAVRCVEDPTLGGGTRALLADVEDVDQRATLAKMPTNGH